MAPKNRAEYRGHVAQVFISALTEKGLEWKAEWDSVSASPLNAVTGKHYRGVNQFYLGILALSRGYTDPRWATMTQIMDKKGVYHPQEKWHLQAGSKAVYVEYWYPYDREEKKMMEWKSYRRLPAEDKASGRYILRVRYTPVFHASMIDGISPWTQPVRESQKLADIVSTLSASMGVELLFDGGNRAFYRPSEDKIHLPDPTVFHGEYEFNATALHELAHATGHETRLNRPHGNGFGTPEYAYEELVAEISSCFMSVTLDVEQMPQHLNNHKAYVQGWIEAIEDKPETLMQAIADAQRAARFMDFHAGLISEAEYAASLGGSIIVSETSLEVPATIHEAAETSIPTPLHQDLVIDDHICLQIDEWHITRTSYILGQNAENADFYHARVTEDGKTYEYEFDRKPTRGEVESAHADFMSERDINRHEAEFGADGSRAFPHDLQRLAAEAVLSAARQHQIDLDVELGE